MSFLTFRLCCIPDSNLLYFYCIPDSNLLYLGSCLHEIFEFIYLFQIPVRGYALKNKYKTVYKKGYSSDIALEISLSDCFYLAIYATTTLFTSFGKNHSIHILPLPTPVQC